jgi:transcriptional regulator with XRE-family HTH domain
MGAMRKSIHTPEYGVLCGELRNARTEADLSQREIAARLRVPHSWIAKVETGERRIDLIEFCRFVAACGKDPSAVFDRVLKQIPRLRVKGGAE